MYYVYSLKYKYGFYVGCTKNLSERLSRHFNKRVPATIEKIPEKLEFYFAVDDKYIAFYFERYLKSGSGRAFIKKHFEKSLI